MYIFNNIYVYSAVLYVFNTNGLRRRGPFMRTTAAGAANSFLERDDPRGNGEGEFRFTLYRFIRFV